MRSLLIIATMCLSLVAAYPNFSEIDVSLNDDWESFKVTYGKTYHPQMELARRMIWEKNLEKVRSHNLDYDLGKHTYALGMNEHTDLSWEEFQAKFLGFRVNMGNASHSASTFLPPLNMGDIPTTVDWRSKGYVTPVKNQQQCGSCWAFSTTGSLEGQHFRKTGKLLSLSEQQLVDCSKAYGNNGCGGGLMDNAFKYIKENGGIDSEESYPYRAKDGHCKFSRDNVVATCTGFVDIPTGDEDSLKQAVATIGPVSVAIDASHSSFQLYKHGVYNEPECDSQMLDHGVLAVGYGTEDGKDYWLVKNSWGPSWGMHGYIEMSRNKDNQCGIATKASYPTV